MIFPGRKMICKPREMILLGREMTFLGRKTIFLGREMIPLGREIIPLGRKMTFLGRKMIFPAFPQAPPSRKTPYKLCFLAILQGLWRNRLPAPTLPVRIPLQPSGLMTIGNNPVPTSTRIRPSHAGGQRGGEGGEDGEADGCFLNNLTSPPRNAPNKLHKLYMGKNKIKPRGANGATLASVCMPQKKPTI